MGIPKLTAAVVAVAGAAAAAPAEKKEDKPKGEIDNEIEEIY